MRKSQAPAPRTRSTDPGRLAGTRTRWAAVAGVTLALFMGTLDFTIVSVALPVIGHELHASPQQTQWVLLAYFLPAVALAVPAGRWVDAAGARTAFLFAVAGFGVASALAAAAPALWTLVAARVVQGVFAGLLGPVGLAVVAGAVLAADRGRALGLIAAAAPLGAVLGPGAGGVLTDVVGWRAVFVVNLPVCLVSLWLGRNTIPGRASPGRALPLPDGRLLRETLLLGSGVAALLLTLDRLGGALGGARFDGLVVALPVLALVAFAAWLRLPESRRLAALVFGRALGTLLGALLFLVAGTNLFYFLIPYFLMDVGGHRPGVAGAVLLAMPAAMAATSLAVNVLAGAWADRLGPRLLVRCGVTVVLAGELLLLPLDADAHPVDVAWRLAVIGAGKGLFMGPNQTVILAVLPRDVTATVGGVSTLVRWLGYALGPALGALCWTLAGGGMPGLRAGVVAAVAVTIAAAVCSADPGRGRGGGQSGRAMKTPVRVGSDAIGRRSPVGTKPRPR